MRVVLRIYLVRSGKTILVVLFKLLAEKRSLMRLSAANCLCHLYNSSAIPAEFEHQIYRQLLPCIIRLFDETSVEVPGIPSCSVQEKSLSLFSALVEKHHILQLKAMVLYLNTGRRCYQ